MYICVYIHTCIYVYTKALAYMHICMITRTKNRTYRRNHSQLRGLSQAIALVGTVHAATRKLGVAYTCREYEDNNGG